MKKLISILIAFCLVCLSGCFPANNNNKQLKSVELAFNDGVLSWQEVEHAEYYELYLNSVFLAKTNELSYDFNSFKVGEYDINVIAVDEEQEYLKSKASLYKLTIESNVKNVDLFMINDTHGAFADGEYNGFTRISSYFTLNDPNSEFVKVANGDIFQGTYVSNVLYGLPLIEAMNELKFDCFVIGNHEFDWGLDVIAKYKDGNLENGEADFPFLGSNIIDKRTNKMPSWIEPYTIIERNGIRVGIIGAIGENQESSILKEHVTNYEFTEVLPKVKYYSKILRNEHSCDLVVVSVHDYDPELNLKIASLPSAERIDLILCGHTHTNILDEYTRTDGKKIFAVQNQDKNKTASFVSIEVKNKEYIKSTFKKIYPANYNVDNQFDDKFSKYDQYLDSGERSLGFTSSSISKQTLGYYSTSAMTEYFGVDISIINTAGVRSNIGSGEITVSDVYNAFPFNNEVFIVELRGSEVKSLYAKNSEFLYFNNSFDINSIINSQYYEIAVIDYVFTGVYYQEFKNKDYVDTDQLLRDLLIEYIDKIY